MTNKAIRKILLLSIFVSIIPALAFSATPFSKKCPIRKTISPEEASEKVLGVTNKYFIPNKSAVLSGKPVEESSLYKVSLNIDNNIQPFYLTKDGALLIFPNGVIDIAKFEESAEKQQQAQKEVIPKTQKPVIELFVMSLCPYGAKAEKDILPITKPFADKIDFKIKFIVNVKGDTINEVVSLHGNDEAKEDARQAAIMQYYPDKLLPYVEKISENSCVISCGAVKLEDYWKKTAQELQMNVIKIESFAYGQEGMNLLKQNEADAGKYSATASPTMVINGVKSSSIYQGAEAVRQAICSAFAVSPSQCQKDREAGL